MAKKKPTLEPAPWDFGPQVLAVLGDVPAMTQAFREYLNRNPKHRAVVTGPPPQQGIEESDAAFRKRVDDRNKHARKITANWMRQNGFNVQTEEAAHVDDEGRKVNPNGVRRAVRLSVAALYRRQGHLTKRQADAADALLSAWEKTQKGPPAIKKVQVDTFPKPDQHIAVIIDRIGGYHRIARLVPQKYAFYVMHVARDDKHITSMPGYRRGVYMDRLRAGLDGLADELGI